MRSPFRDENEAAQLRIAQLERENAELKARMNPPLTVPAAPARGAMSPVRMRLGFAVCITMGLFGAAAARRHSSVHHLAPPPAAASESPTDDRLQFIRTFNTPPDAAAVATIDDAAFLLGQEGFIRHLTAAPERVPGTRALYAGVGTKDRHFVVGALGTILTSSRTEQAWTSEPAPAPADLRGVTMLGDTAWAVGAHGAILRRHEDGSWSREESPVTVDLYAIARFGDKLYAVGDQGTILARKSAQSGWVEEPSGVSTRLNAAIGYGSALYVVGNSGTILRRAPDVWVREASHTTNDLYAIAGDDRRLLAAGERWTVLRSNDSGDWSAQEMSMPREESLQGSLVGMSIAQKDVWLVSSTLTYRFR